jgi:pimeloyl-ACP methyl ester carboxylesterase
MEGMTMDDPTVITLGDGSGSTLLNESYLDVVMQLPLPGIVIFVHGVNSDGEWFQAAERGLCDGLNRRLARRDWEIVHANREGGKLSPVEYLDDLTADGYLNPEKQPDTFIAPSPHYSPVIQFRWGYKAGAEELQTYGDGIFLNEQNYWGGGPFANGCTSLPDLWGRGLNDQLFLWLHAQHLNPTNDRMVYACPPRPYYVLAALRLAKLIKAIREKQADVPITIVCHSQGNMVSMAAAFLGDRIGMVTDGAGNSRRCVADSYVLCNPPYSLLKKNLVEAWSGTEMAQGELHWGRQSLNARKTTLKNFFDIIRKQAENAQAPDKIDAFMKNEAHKFSAETDREQWGYGPNKTNHGRVTLYFNPHDQVISASPVQGIGWRGMSKDEIDATEAHGVFCQRVFAEKFTVGKEGLKTYHFWKNHHGSGLKPGSQNFWYPESPRAKYAIQKGLDANKNWLAKVATVATAPVFYLVTALIDIRINALPDNNWETPLEAPKLPEPFEPKSKRFGKIGDVFDEGTDAPGASRDRERVHEEGDPYATDKGGKAEGNKDTEASLRYEHHALLRMRARREDLHQDSDESKGLYRNSEFVTEEDNPDRASDAYKAWRTKKIKETLAENIKAPATDHSSIMTNPDHAERALAYDIPVGVCHIEGDDMHLFRKMADWRYLKGLNKNNEASQFFEYFGFGTFKDGSVYEWAKNDGEGKMPAGIFSETNMFGI